MTELEVSILDFEGKWWQQRGHKETEIRRLFGMSAIRYAQCLTHLLDDADAQRYDPLLVNRLRRIRDRRAAAREQRRHLT